MNKLLKIMKMKRITYKLFMTTSIILLAFATLIYVTLYFFLPKFYEQYKTDQLQIGIEEIIDKSKNLTFQNAIPLLDDYAQKNNAGVYLQNQEGAIIYSPSFYFVSGNNQVFSVDKSEKIMTAENVENARNSYQTSIPIQFQDVNLTLFVSATFQPIDEASQVLVRFLPYISIIVLVIAVGSAYFYSRFITKPLLYINEGAQKMANLNFSEK
ncbi:two-component sensor histidine kinase, partial [Bacillus cereus]|nr:two-component sensor histidine kinase [Bacillus cereus]